MSPLYLFKLTTGVWINLAHFVSVEPGRPSGCRVRVTTKSQPYHDTRSVDEFLENVHNGVMVSDAV